MQVSPDKSQEAPRPMAYRYTFTGVVHPERAVVNVSTITWRLDPPAVPIVGKLTVTIAVSQVTAVFEAENEVSDLNTLKNYVADAVRVEVDTLGYLNGCGYEVEIVQLIPAEATTPLVFGVGIPALGSDSSELPSRFLEIMQVFQDPRGSYLQRCFADLREAIRSPKDTGFFCYRGIEALRQFFVLESGAKGHKNSWDELRQALGVERATIDYVKDFADPVRHGAAKPIADHERAEVFRKTWAVVARFIEFAKRGYKTVGDA